MSVEAFSTLDLPRYKRICITTDGAQFSRLKNNLKILFAILLLLGSGAVLYNSLIGPGPRFDLAIHEAIGNAMATEAAALAGEGGRIILVTRNLASNPNPPAAAEVKALAATLQKLGRKVASTNSFRVDPLRLFKVPPGDIVEVLRKMEEKDVLISFLGPPDLDEKQLARAGEKHPKIVALCSGTMPRQINLKKLFEQQLVHVAIVSRSETGTANPAEGAGASSFDTLYSIIKPANVSELTAYAK
ncbi:MAG TPA: hypothetical protein VMZ27_10845 [Candidatus Saccharimonadales bacterium]|nr:hypothetical protein [Candidatus Saccharimonadales bacterium]